MLAKRVVPQGQKQLVPESFPKLNLMFNNFVENQPKKQQILKFLRDI